MSTTYLSVDYFPLTVNFFDRDAIELAEAKYGIRVDGAVCKLLCKIFKEGYYIPWGEEQSLIFARKLGGELKGKEIDGIIQILLDKGFFDKESYEKFQILTSLEIQHTWIDATCRRKRKLEDLPYLLVNDTQKQEKENNTKDANNSSVQGELKLENENISPEIADISGQSRREKKSRRGRRQYGFAFARNPRLCLQQEYAQRQRTSGQPGTTWSNKQERNYSYSQAVGLRKEGDADMDHAIYHQVGKD